MNKRLAKAATSVVLGSGLALFSGMLMAGEVCDPKKEKCDRPAACSPGYWKNHQDTWCGITCPSGITISDCTALNNAFYSTGAGNGRLKQAAGAYINNECYEGSAELTPCEED